MNKEIDVQRENRKQCALAQVKIILQNMEFIDKMDVLNRLLRDESKIMHKTTD